MEIKGTPRTPAIIPGFNTETTEQEIQMFRYELKQVLGLISVDANRNVTINIGADVLPIAAKLYGIDTSAVPPIEGETTTEQLEGGITRTKRQYPTSTPRIQYRETVVSYPNGPSVVAGRTLIKLGSQ